MFRSSGFLLQLPIPVQGFCDKDMGQKLTDRSALGAEEGDPSPGSGSKKGKGLQIRLNPKCSLSSPQEFWFFFLL